MASEPSNVSVELSPRTLRNMNRANNVRPYGFQLSNGSKMFIDACVDSYLENHHNMNEDDISVIFDTVKAAVSQIKNITGSSSMHVNKKPKEATHVVNDNKRKASCFINKTKKHKTLSSEEDSDYKPPDTSDEDDDISMMLEGCEDDQSNENSNSNNDSNETDSSDDNESNDSESSIEDDIEETSDEDE